jgi:hypothetical protein
VEATAPVIEVLAVVWILTTIVVGFTAFYAGRGSVTSHRPAALPEPKAICLCGHSYASHNPDKPHRPCVVDLGATRNGQWIKHGRCACLEYTGPTPLPTIIP